MLGLPRSDSVVVNEVGKIGRRGNAVSPVLEDARRPAVTAVRPQPFLDERAQCVPSVGELVRGGRDAGNRRADQPHPLSASTGSRARTLATDGRSYRHAT